MRSALGGDDQRIRVSVFSAKQMGETVRTIDEIEGAGLFVYDEGFVNESLNVLGQHRLLLLIGDGGSGKESMARYLASRLREDGAIERETLLIRPLSSDVRLSLHSSLRDDGELRDRVVLFPDALERGNPGLTDFVGRLKGGDVNNIGRDLERVKAYLILTATETSLPPDCARALPNWLRPRMTALSAERLLLGVEQRIAWLRDQGLDPALAQKVIPELPREIAIRAGTISRAVLFIQSSLAAVLRGETTVQKAFDELDATVSWFENSVEKDREAWIFALAVVMSHSLGRDDEVPWTEFFEIYEALRAHLLRGRRTEAAGRPFDDEPLRRCAGAVIRRDTAFPQDLIAFEDPGAAHRLWTVLLSRFRSVANRLVPVLLSLTGSRNIGTRARAAGALGRIGWLDAALAHRWIEEWARSESWSQRALAGHLALGVFSAGDAPYRDFLLRVLDEYSEHEGKAWTAIAAYKQIGSIDLPLALEKLRGIARKHLAPAFEETRAIRSLMEQLERSLARLHPVEAAFVQEVLNSLHSFFIDSLKGKEEIAESVKFALVTLAITKGLAPVLAALNRWAIDSDGMGAFVCNVVLNRGIAAEMTRRRVELVLRPGDDTEIVTCSAMLASLVDDSQAVQTVVRFLETMYAMLVRFFPLDAATALIHVLFDYLKTWVRESLEVPLCRAAMEELAGRLLSSNLTELAARTYDWLSASDFSKGEMAAFASEARRFSMKVG